MKTLLLTTVLALSASAALASPQIPTWANPYPDQPVATDGSPLPRQAFQGGVVTPFDAVVTGRSVVVTHHRH